MSQQIRIHEPLGQRTAALPIDVGGAGAALSVPGLEGHALSISASGRQWLAQVQGDAAVLLNGITLRGAQPLADGDVITLGDAQLVVQPGAGLIDVVHLGGNATVAPLRQQLLPGDEVVAGVREIIAANAPEVVAPADQPVRSRARWIGGAVAAALVLAAIGLLATLVPVALRVDPAGATIEAPGSLAWQSEGRIFLLPGRRTLAISHPGYRDQAVTLDVTRALRGATPLNVALEYLPGVVEIDTGGVDSEVLVDGLVVGKAPGEVSVPAGARTLVLRAPRHVDHVAQLEIEGGGTHQQLKVQLQPAVGVVSLDTQPTGAIVRIDGHDKGTAPQKLELDAGLHLLTLSAPGRRAWSSEIAVIAGQTLDLGRIDLALPPAAGLRAAAAAVPAAAPVTMPAASASASAETAAPRAPRTPPAARAQSALLGTLVLLPAGEYVQGSERREQGRRNNEVQRRVKLTRGFYMSATEISNLQFNTFKPGHVAGIAMEKSLDLDGQAVSNVSWNDAVEFCNWLSLRENLPAAYERRDGRWQLVQPLNMGYRLPTEAEWEYAVRYVDGQRWQRYAWGDALPPPPGAANLAGEEIIPKRQSNPNAVATVTLPQYRDEHEVIAPVGSYARSAAGLFDMGGNLSEWTHDVYESLPSSDAVTDPMGPATDGPHAIRGANWRSTGIAELRAAWRERGAGPSQTIGFRVVRFAGEAP